MDQTTLRRFAVAAHTCLGLSPLVPWAAPWLPEEFYPPAAPAAFCFLLAAFCEAALALGLTGQAKLGALCLALFTASAWTRSFPSAHATPLAPNTAAAFFLAALAAASLARRGTSGRPLLLKSLAAGIWVISFLALAGRALNERALYTWGAEHGMSSLSALALTLAGMALVFSARREEARHVPGVRDAQLYVHEKDSSGSHLRKSSEITEKNEVNR